MFTIQRISHDHTQTSLQGIRIDGRPFTINIIKTSSPVYTSRISIYYANRYYNIRVEFRIIPNHNIYNNIIYRNVIYPNTVFPCQQYEIPPIIYSCISGMINE